MIVSEASQNLAAIKLKIYPKKEPTNLIKTIVKKNPRIFFGSVWRNNPVKIKVDINQSPVLIKFEIQF